MNFPKVLCSVSIDICCTQALTIFFKFFFPFLGNACRHRYNSQASKAHPPAYRKPLTELHVTPSYKLQPLVYYTVATVPVPQQSQPMITKASCGIQTDVSFTPRYEIHYCITQWYTAVILGPFCSAQIKICYSC